MRHRWGPVLVGMFLLSATGAESCEFYIDPNDPDADVDTDTDGDADSDTAEIMTFHYVLIRDLASNDDPGMELDAVALIHDGAPLYADDWHECIMGPGMEDVETTDEPNEALGPPNNENGECAADDTFYVNLGGLGGSIVLSFDSEREIAEGDVIRIYECGPQGPSEPYDVMIGTTATIEDQSWVRCAFAASGVSECIVPPLPEIPVYEQ